MMILSLVMKPLILMAALQAQTDSLSAVGQESYQIPASSVTLSQKQKTCLAGLLKACSKKKILSISAMPEMQLRTQEKVACQSLRVNEGDPEEDCDIQMDTKDGTIYSFTTRNSWDKDGAPGLKHKDAISKEAAFQAARPLLEYYGLPQCQSDYDITLRDIGRMESEDDLWGSAWQILKRFEYQGLPCRGSAILIAVSPTTAKIESVLYRPIVIPPTPAKEISKKEALAAAQEWLAEATYFQGTSVSFDQDAETKIQKVIAKANRAFTERELLIDPITRQSQAYYCWEVPFSYVEHARTFPSSLWVNVETGEVIGAKMP